MKIFSIKIISFFLIILAIPSYSQFWIKISEYSGYKMLIDNRGVIFLGGLYDHPVIYVSEDEGSNFHERARFTGDFVTCISKSGSDNAVYVGTSHQGIFKTTDNGLSWNNIGLKKEYINSILSTYAGDLYAGTDYYIFHSTDEGVSWRADSLRLPGMVNNLLTWSLFEDSAGFLYAGTECGLYRSTDNGISWNHLASFNCGDILSFTEKDNKLYMGGADRFHGIHRSNDQGLSWTDIFSQARTTYSIIAAPDSNIYIAGRGGIYRTNGVDTLWEEINSGLPELQSFHALFNIEYSPNGYLYTVCGGLYRSKEKIFQPGINKPEVPINFLLLQNYPNPFNTTTIIKFLIPQQSNLTITIYDTMGREIYKLVNEEKAAGSYEISWNAANFPSGVYFYRMKAGEFISTNKMLLLK
jgi:photosystem II stability/assembly factor-like uncharacterized protein